MDIENIFYLIGAACLLAGIVSGAAASNKGRDGLGWFILGVLFAPIALPLVLVAKPNYGNMDGFKSCNYCIEPVHVKAIKCRYCGSELKEVEQERMSLPNEGDLSGIEKERIISKAESLGFKVDAHKGSSRITLSKNGKNHDFFIMERAKKFLDEQ